MISYCTKNVSGVTDSRQLLKFNTISAIHSSHNSRSETMQCTHYCTGVPVDHAGLRILEAGEELLPVLGLPRRRRIRASHPLENPIAAGALHLAPAQLHPVPVLIQRRRVAGRRCGRRVGRGEGGGG
jgi:hypothetical protein